ncbi:MAG: histidine triad nucleotide-binding protein [Anaerolineales bacterium]|nr:histidine triad nucleotide-binding protein [Anaerolineales bacterium]
MSDCIFCRILAGEIPSDQVYQDEQVTAFRDIHPAAPTHILIIPNRHIVSVNALAAVDESLAGHMILVAQQIAAEQGIRESGYRLIINTGPDGGQEVHHLHLHLLGGQRMQHPMG